MHREVWLVLHSSIFPFIFFKWFASDLNVFILDYSLIFFTLVLNDFAFAFLILISSFSVTITVGSWLVCSTHVILILASILFTSFIIGVRSFWVLLSMLAGFVFLVIILQVLLFFLLILLSREHIITGSLLPCTYSVVIIISFN